MPRVTQTCVNHGAAMIFMSGIENAIQLWSFLFFLDQTPITNHPKDTPPPELGMLKWKSPLSSFGMDHSATFVAQDMSLIH